MKKSKFLAFAMALLLLVALLGGCVQAFAETETAEEEKYGGTLKIALGAAVSGKAIDPVYTNSSSVDQITQQYGEGLVRATKTGDYVPAFATSWETSEDGLVWTFYLRQGVHFQKGAFQDGREVTADDVVYCAERTRTQHWNNPLFMVDSIEKVDDYTVQFHLNQPFASFLNNCASSNMIMIPKEDVEGWGEDFGLHPTSIGPFQVVEHVADQYTKMVRNETYWGTRPYLDKLEYYCITDSAQALNALLTGEVDVVLSLSADAIKQIKSSDAVNLYQGPENRVAYIGFNARYGELTNPEVRKALIMAVDTSVLASAYQEGMASENRLPLPVTSWGYDEALVNLVPSFDPEGAKQALADAGYPNGFKIRCSLVNTNEAMRAATIVQAYWSAIGVNLEIVPVSQAELTELYTNATIQTWAGTQGGTFDPATILGYFTSRAKLNTNQNSFGYDKDATEALNYQALSLSDKEARKAIYKEIMTDFLNDNLGIFYANVNQNMAASKRVHGLTLESKTVLTICGAPDTGVNIWVEE